MPTFLLINRRNGTFKERAFRAGVATDHNGGLIAGMGVNVAELANGERVIAIGNLGCCHTLIFLRSKNYGLFNSDVCPLTGTAEATSRVTTFGLLFLDYDLDDRPDLLQANGSIISEAGSATEGLDFEQPMQLSGGGRTTAQLATGRAREPFQRLILGRGAAFADMDAIGALDLLVTVNGGSPILLRNQPETRHHGIRIKFGWPAWQSLGHRNQS